MLTGEIALNNNHYYYYFHLFKSSAALEAEPGLKMVVYRLLADDESVQLASQINALPPLKGKVVLPSDLLHRPDRGRLA